jgi:phosphoribosylanthranilate isomerase
VTKVKFCGMTNLADSIKAVDLAADFIGFVFYRKSKRYISPEEVKKITGVIGDRTRTVGVFVDESDGEIKETMDYCGLDFCQVFRQVPHSNSITVYRVKDRLPAVAQSEKLILLDAYSEGFGGSGKSFDLSLLRGASFLPRAFIAGGISKDNLADVLELKPFAVDLVSAIESNPGKKDHDKMEAFINTVRSLET